MKYIIKCKDCVYGCDSMEDVARLINVEWDDFIYCYEMEYADVAPNCGRFWDITEKACLSWIEFYSGEAEYAFGELSVPLQVKFHCPDDIDEIESEIRAEGDWLREAVRDYRSSTGIVFNR